MYPRVLLTLVLVALASGTGSPSVTAQAGECALYQDWASAQTEFEMIHEGQSLELDPDGDGIACEHLQNVPGFAPTYWTNQLPDGVVPVLITDVIDGDTFLGIVNRVPETIELERAWAPDVGECGATEAMAATEDLLRRKAIRTTIYIEVSDRGRFGDGQLAAYVWLSDPAGNLYMLNEALIRSGWTADDATGDGRYDQQMVEASAFAEGHRLGNWRNCPDGPDPGQTPTPPMQPEVTPEPTLPPPPPTETPLRERCESSYPTLCIPPVPEIDDLDCWQIDAKNFPTNPPDSHNFDLDKDGLGCEPYNP